MSMKEVDEQVIYSDIWTDDLIMLTGYDQCLWSISDVGEQAHIPCDIRLDAGGFVSQ